MDPLVTEPIGGVITWILVGVVETMTQGNLKTSL